jgi:hypothetical protein
MSAGATRPDDRTPFSLLLVRHIIPAVIVLGGIVAYLLNPSMLAAEGAAGIIGAGLAWWLFGWLYRQGAEGELERDEEEAAREFLDEHGRWPTDEEAAHFSRYGRWPGRSAGTAGRAAGRR